MYLTVAFYSSSKVIHILHVSTFITGKIMSNNVIPHQQCVPASNSFFLLPAFIRYACLHCLLFCAILMIVLFYRICADSNSENEEILWEYTYDWWKLHIRTSMSNCELPVSVKSAILLVKQNKTQNVLFYVHQS